MMKLGLDRVVDGFYMITISFIMIYGVNYLYPVIMNL